jgi:hypothetical protein
MLQRDGTQKVVASSRLTGYARRIMAKVNDAARKQKNGMFIKHCLLEDNLPKVRGSMYCCQSFVLDLHVKVFLRCVFRLIQR